MREIIYVAFGYEYLLIAAHSASSSKAHNQDIVCSVVTNVKAAASDTFRLYFDSIHILDMDSDQNREIKTTVINYLSADECVFLDCDTEVRGDLSPMFRCLGTFDIILKLLLHPTPKDYDIGDGIKGEHFPVWNSGVIFFRKNEKISLFFSQWNKIFRDMGRRSDQPALARTIYENPDIRVLSVGYIWNTFKSDIPLLQKNGGLSKTRILHYRDASKFPEIAEKILAIHHRVCTSLPENHPFLPIARETAYRYKVFSSPWYKNKVTRSLYLYVLKLGARLGFLPDFSLMRVRLKKGDPFNRLTS